MREALLPYKEKQEKITFQSWLPDELVGSAGRLGSFWELIFHLFWKILKECLAV